MRPSKEKEIGALAKKLDRDLGELKQRAAAGDQSGSEDLLAKAIESLNKVKAKVAEEAPTRTDDPARREALLKAIADLEKRLNDLKVNAREAVRAPSDKQKQAKLEDTVHETKKPIQELLEATVNQPPAPVNPVAKANIILAKMKASKTGKTVTTAIHIRTNLYQSLFPFFRTPALCCRLLVLWPMLWQV